MINSTTNQVKKVIGTIMAIILPALLAGVIALFYYVKTGNTAQVPQWNDEAAYYELIKTWLATGAAKGYWGFCGGHAILGTGGAWSPAILLPYAIFGMMFGWQYASVIWANVVFLCLANLLFILIVKPDRKTLIKFMLLELLSSHILLYTNTIMSEVFRYALAILLAGMLYRILFEESYENKKDEREKQTGYKIFKYLVVPLYIIALTQIYTFFAFAVPIYVIAVMKKSKWWKRLIAAFLSMAVVAGGSYYLLHLISSNYNIHKTETLLTALQKKDIFGALRTFLWMFKVGVYDLIQCFLASTGHGLFHWFVPFLALLVICPLVKLAVDFAWKKKKDLWTHDNQIFLTVSYSIGIFIFMYITVYSLEYFTFYRGLGIAVMFVMPLLLLLENQKIYLGFFLLYAIGILFVPSNLADFNTERYISSQEQQQWTDLAKEWDNVFTIQTEADSMTDFEIADMEELGRTKEEEIKWNNTVIMYTMEPKVICAIPAGLGVNFMMYSDDIVEDAGYLVFSLEKEQLRGDWLEQSYADIYGKYADRINANYYIHYTNEDYIIYKHRTDGDFTEEYEEQWLEEHNPKNRTGRIEQEE